MSKRETREKEKQEIRRNMRERETREKEKQDRKRNMSERETREKVKQERKRYTYFLPKASNDFFFKKNR